MQSAMLSCSHVVIHSVPILSYGAMWFYKLYLCVLLHKVCLCPVVCRTLDVPVDVYGPGIARQLRLHTTIIIPQLPPLVHHTIIITQSPSSHHLTTSPLLSSPSHLQVIVVGDP